MIVMDGKRRRTAATVLGLVAFFFGFRSFAKTEVGREENVIEILLVDPVLRALTAFFFSSGRSESKSTNQSSQSNF